MKPEPEKVQPPAQEQNERKPMLAPTGGAQPLPGTGRRNFFGLATVAALSIGLSAALVFRGGTKAPPPAPVQVQAVTESLPGHPLPELPTVPAPQAQIENQGGQASLMPILLDSGHPAYDFFRPGQKKADMARKIELLNSLAKEALKTAHGEKPSSAMQGILAELEQTAAAPGRSARPAAAPAENCQSCQNSLAARRGQANTLPTGTYFIGQRSPLNGLKQNFIGMCDGKYVYEFRNPSAKARNVNIITQAGETWDFRLGPAESSSVKSSTEFIGGSYSVTWR